jgi:hypothetical protein
MQAISQGYSRRRIDIPHIPLTKGMEWGLISGLAATLVMDLILMGILAAAGLPALTCFSIIGATLARFLSLPGIPITGSVPLGIAAHYMIGPVMGGIFGAAAVKVDAFRVDTPKKGVVLAVLYAEILSQPMLALTPILLRMTAAETLQWFGGSFGMHLIWGGILGVFMSHWLRLSIAAYPKSRYLC